QLSRTELCEIYSGATKEWAPLGWKRGGEIIALTAGPRWGIFAYLEQTLLQSGAYAKTIYAPPTEEEAVEVVATRANAIACVSRVYAERAGARVRILRVSQALGLPYVALNRETLMTRTYPLLRPISIATSAKPSATASAFITFASGMDGQRIVARHGYVPAAVPIEIIRTSEGTP
ncbi:MAG: substrate-binding domain-containing protein, partial [Candidatus Eiseniibacteriota bacterium]